ncbi:MAG: orotidine-5'-phosphate decarboxylase [Thermoguttaceae bacterium]|nr:orotidine-5'-phosphate decarboxylase [Thermoguttaceae bacterium]
MLSFSDRLALAIAEKRTPVLVGLDPRWAQLPVSFTDGVGEPTEFDFAEAYSRFCHEVIDVVAPLVPAVKPQAAFFEQCGPDAMRALAGVIHYAQSKGLVVILDGKRNDIGSTAAAYAAGLLGRGSSPWSADALTVSPYLGDDSLAPFIETAKERDAGVFVLVKTSNPGGKLFQDLIADGKPVYQHVAEWVESASRDALPPRSPNPYSCVGAVVGATWPKQLAEMRQTLRSCWLLVPGYGSQGGGAKDVAGAFDDRGMGAVINNSRGIIFAHKKPEYAKFGEKKWQQAVEAATLDMIDALAAETTAGKLR